MVELYCICRKPDTGRLMVGCDGCDDWFHFECMDINPKYQQLIVKFLCKKCGDKIYWKKKCKLETCFQPLKPLEESKEQTGTEKEVRSKYCCEQHGLDYIEKYLSKITNEKDMLVLQQLVKGQDGQASVSFDEFKSVLSDD